MIRARTTVKILAVFLGAAASWAGWIAPRAVAQANLALHQPVASSGPNWGSFKPGALTDGDPATFTHPLADSGTAEFYYEVDLGGARRIERIALRNRGDGCCPERLSRYRVEIWTDDGGAAGLRVWNAVIRADGSHSSVGGLDVVTAAADPAGIATGRFVRVVNHAGDAYSPQLAEIEVYGGALPTIRRFVANDDALDPGGRTLLQWETVNAVGAVIEPDVGAVPASAGTLLVAPTRTTTYTLLATNENGGSQASVTIGVGIPVDPPVLAEFMAENDGVLKDQDGDASDWIEIHNPNPISLRVGGYSLTDDPTRTRLWPLPDVRIAPGGFLVVFASAKDRRDPADELHTDFRLGSDGDYVALVGRDGRTVVSQYPTDHPATALYPRQRANLSYGLGLDGRVGYLRPATPGATNGPGYEDVVADTKFSRDRGLHDTGFSVAVTSATPDAVIRYTTDRSLPSPTRGQVYTGPVAITNTTVLRAVAYKEGWAPTDVDTHTYIFPSNVIASAVMRRSITANATYLAQLPAALREIPSLSIVAGGTLNDTSEVGASMEWLPTERDTGTAVQLDCGVRLFGGAFTDFAKKSFRLYFRGRYGTPRFEAPIFAGFDRGLPAVESFDQLELRSGSHDMQMRGFYMSNVFTDDTMLEMGQLNPHGRFVHLYLNGTYWGVYHLRERWGAAMHQSYLGGESSAYESINGNWNVGGWADPGVPYDGDGSTWARLKSVRREYSQARALLDVPQFVDFMTMWMFGGSEDEWRCVGPTSPGTGFKFYLNDADGWLCVPQYCAAGNRTVRGSPGRQAGDGPGSLFSMLFAGADPDYRSLLADRIHRAMSGDGALMPARNAERLRRRTSELERPFIAESARWGYLTPTEWAARRDSVFNAWFPRRTGEVLTQYRSAGFYPSLAAPMLNRPGGVVTRGFQVRFNGPPTGAILFTLDGSDPRLPGGTPHPGASSFRPAAGGGGPETPLPAGLRWRWFTDPAGLGASDVVSGHPAWSPANWKHPDFEDGGWSDGPAQLGYGEGDESTVLPFGSAGAKWITAYFRRSVVITNVAAISVVTVRLKADDGAIVYLNGSEAFRAAMPAGVATATTRAENATDDGRGFASFEVAPALLREGVNVIAVELHQSSPTSSDASFDLEFGIERPLTPGPVAFEVARNTIVKARTLLGTQWSALTEAFLQTDSEALNDGDLVVRELQVRPAGTNGVEFLELENSSGHAVNLRGARFVEGIRFSFPDNRDTLLAPGQRVVLSSDLQRYRARYGLEVPVAGRFEGSLDNAGERVRLVNSAGETRLVLAYGGAAPWPEDLDRTGHSLVLAQPELGMSNPSAWRPSVQPGGSPGGIDSLRFAGEQEVDADGDGLPALVEYALGTSDRDPASGPGSFAPGFDSDGWFTLTVSRRLGTDDVRLWVEESADMMRWSQATRRSVTAGTAGQGSETWGARAMGRNGVFLRLLAERGGSDKAGGFGTGVR